MMSSRRRLPQRRCQAKEQDIQRTVIQHLAWCAHPDAFCFHVPLGGYRKPIEAILKSIGTIVEGPAETAQISRPRYPRGARQ
jgi:hypothetical protein